MLDWISGYKGLPWAASISIQSVLRARHRQIARHHKKTGKFTREYAKQQALRRRRDERELLIVEQSNDMERESKRRKAKKVYHERYNTT